MDDGELLTAKDDGYGSDADLFRKRVFGPPALSRSLERRLTRFAKKKFIELTTWKDFMVLALLWSVFHQSVNVQAQIPSSDPAGCMIHSPVIILLCLTAFAITLLVVVWREGIGTRLPTAVELAISVFDVAFGLLLAASAGTFKWHTSADRASLPFTAHTTIQFSVRVPWLSRFQRRRDVQLARQPRVGSGHVHRRCQRHAHTPGEQLPRHGDDAHCTMHLSLPRKSLFLHSSPLV